MLIAQPNMRVLDEQPLDHVPDDEELRRHLGGGWLEQVPQFIQISYRGQSRRCVAFCDEDGKRKGLPVNQYATILWRFSQIPGREIADVLVGPVLIVYGDKVFMASL